MKFDEITHLKGQRDRAVMALKGLMARIEDGTLCRDVSRDHEPMWVSRAMELVEILNAAQSVLSEMKVSG